LAKEGKDDNAMKKIKLIPMAILVFAMLSVFPGLAHAGEVYFYQGESGFSASFFLIGGQYSLYVYAKRPVRGFSAPEARSCLFGGNFERVWPTPDAMSLGSGITISTIVPHKIGPTSITMIAGLYRVYIPPLTTCEWKFVLNSTNQNTAGVAGVQMFKIGNGHAELSAAASVKDQVEFYALYRTANDARVPVSGVMQIINAAKVVETFPLQVTSNQSSGATVLYHDVKWDQASTKYLGKNIAKFVVQIGSAEFTSTGEFTLTQ
jgi:hypothetical protein